MIIITSSATEPIIVKLPNSILNIRAERAISIYPVLTGNSVTSHFADFGVKYNSSSNIVVKNLTKELSDSFTAIIATNNEVLINSHLGDYNVVPDKYTENYNTGTFYFSILSRLDNISI